MADYFAAGRFQTPTSTGIENPVTAAGLGFTPIAFVLWPLGAITPGTAVTACRVGQSYIVGSTVRSNAVYRQGANTRRRTSMAGGEAVQILTNGGQLVTGESLIDGSGDLEVDYTAVDSNAYQVMWLALGGDTMSAQTVGAGTAGFTTTGLDPELAFCAHTDMGDDDVSVICLLGTSFGTATHQWNTSFSDNFLNETADDYSDAVDNSLPGRLLFHTWDGTNLAATFGTDGATWSFDAQTAACDVLAIAGIERNYASGDFAKDDSGTADATDALDPGFDPGIMHFKATGRATKGDPAASDNYGTMSEGFATPDEQFCYLTSIADSGNGGDATVLYVGYCIALGNDAESPTALAYYDYTTKELVWEVNDTNPALIGWLALEEDAGGGPDEISIPTQTRNTIFGAHEVEGTIAHQTFQKNTIFGGHEIEGVIAHQTFQKNTIFGAHEVEGTINHATLDRSTIFGSHEIEGTISAATLGAATTFGAHAVEGIVSLATLARATSFGTHRIEGTIAHATFQRATIFGAHEITADLVVPTLVRNVSIGAHEIEGTIAHETLTRTVTIGAHEVVQADVQVSTLSFPTIFGAHEIEGTIDLQTLQRTVDISGHSVTADITIPTIIRNVTIGAHQIEGTIAVETITASTSFGAHQIQGSINATTVQATTTIGAHEIIAFLQHTTVQATTTIGAHEVEGTIIHETLQSTVAFGNHIATGEDISPPSTPEILEAQKVAISIEASINMPTPEELPYAMFYVYRGNTGPSWRIRWKKEDGQLETFVGATIELLIRKKDDPDAVTFTLAGSINVEQYPASAPRYNLRIDWDESDTDREPGIYEATLRVTWANGVITTAPFGPLEFYIAANLDD